MNMWPYPISKEREISLQIILIKALDKEQNTLVSQLRSWDSLRFHATDIMANH